MGNSMAVAENYPDLKAQKMLLILTEELRSTENKIALLANTTTIQLSRQ